MGHTLYHKWALNRKSSVLPEVTQKPHNHVAWSGSVMGAICLEEGWAEANGAPVAIFPYLGLLRRNSPWSEVLSSLSSTNLSIQKPKVQSNGSLKSKAHKSCRTTHQNNMKKLRSLGREEVGVKGVGVLTFTAISPPQLQIPQKNVCSSFLT